MSSPPYLVIRNFSTGRRTTYNAPAIGYPPAMGTKLKMCPRYYRRVIVASICAMLFLSQIALYKWNQAELETSVIPTDRLFPRIDKADASLIANFSVNPLVPEFTLHGVTNIANDSLFEFLTGVHSRCRPGLPQEVASAFGRAVSLECKKEIVDVACRHQHSELYSNYVSRSCPLNVGENFGHYVGCYGDNLKNRILPDFTAEFKEINTPTVCVYHCLHAGYKYAGVENSYECYCGHSLVNATGLEISDKMCAVERCPGNHSLNCGGHLTIAVHMTGYEASPVPYASYVNLSAYPAGFMRKGPVRIVFVLTVNGRALRQVHRLLRAIYRPHHYYFIHVDKRQQYLYRGLSKIGDALPNVRLATNRYASIWGGASLLTMLLACMKELLLFEDWKDWDYFLNLSESDYPVKTVEELEVFLLKNKGKNFVKSHGKDTPRFIRKQGLNMLFLECDNHMWRLGTRTLPSGIRVDGGSDWVCLTRSFSQYLTGPEDSLLSGLKAYWKYALLPAESFFHTVLQNSAFCGTVVNNNLHLTNWRRKQGCKCQYKHIVDWCGCSPNVIRIDDIQKVLDTQGWPIYFGRKFEAIINQEVINQVDLLFLNIPQTTGDDSFWLNEFHADDILLAAFSNLSSSHSDDTVRSHYESLARVAITDLPHLCQDSELNAYSMRHKLSLEQLIGGTVYNQNDEFHGLIVSFNVKKIEINQDNHRSSSSVLMEAMFRPEPTFHVLNRLKYPKRLISVEVGSNFDPKEELFRNYASLLGPLSDIVLKFVWNAGPEVTVTAVLIDPAGVLAASYDVTVADAAVVHAHQAELSKPLRPGRWTVRILYKWTIVANTTFVILPFSHISGQPITYDSARTLHSGPGRPYVEQDFGSALRALLRLDSDEQKLHMLAEENAAKHGAELNRWIEDLIHEHWTLSGSCVVRRGVAGGSEKVRIDWPCPQTACDDTSWSTCYPDPKSEIVLPGGAGVLQA